MGPWVAHGFYTTELRDNSFGFLLSPAGFSGEGRFVRRVSTLGGTVDGRGTDDVGVVEAIATYTCSIV